MKPYEAYLYYNNSDSERTLMLLSEGNAWEAQQASGSRMNAPAARPAVGSWQYDASRFRDNMSMVARLEGVADSERYTVGAFVDNECRGEGRCYDGLMFITVHANQGEQVSFRLEDSYSGQQYDVEETTTMTLMRGSLKQPFTLTSLGVTTGISSMQNAPATDAQHYDLGGRTVNSGNAKGLTIERRADGTVLTAQKTLVNLGSGTWNNSYWYPADSLALSGNGLTGTPDDANDDGVCTMTINAGTSTQITTSVTPAKANQHAIWYRPAGEDKDIATIDADGTVYAHKAGTIKYVAYTPSRSVLLTITVK